MTPYGSTPGHVGLADASLPTAVQKPSAYMTMPTAPLEYADIFYGDEAMLTAADGFSPILTA